MLGLLPIQPPVPPQRHCPSDCLSGTAVDRAQGCARHNPRAEHWKDDIAKHYSATCRGRGTAAGSMASFSILAGLGSAALVPGPRPVGQLCCHLGSRQGLACKRHCAYGLAGRRPSRGPASRASLCSLAESAGRTRRLAAWRGEQCSASSRPARHALCTHVVNSIFDGRMCVPAGRARVAAEL